MSSDPDPPDPDLADAVCETPVPEEPSVPEEHVRLVEAAIFASAAPVPRGQLAALLGEGSDLDGVLKTLSARYAGAGVVPVEAAGGWMFRTADDLGPILAQSFAPPRKLTRAAVETLAVIAWHQPLTRTEIEALRGASVSGDIFEALTALEFIAPAGRRETPGRPVLWATTDAFLAHFGLAQLSDLPDWRQVKELGLGLSDAAEAALPGAEPEAPTQSAEPTAEG
jgi:segregation and condensation protein B